MSMTEQDDLQLQIGRMERKLELVGRRVLLASLAVARRLLVWAITFAWRYLPRRLFGTAAAARDRKRKADRQRSEETSLSHGETQNTFQSEKRNQALEILCTAGTLKACARHGSHFLHSGDLVAAHRLAARSLLRSSDSTAGGNTAALSDEIDSVYEEISQHYRCESCYHELRAQLLAV